MPVVYESGAVPGHLARVLVVDDEEGLCELACMWLESLDYEVVGVDTPALALELLGAGHFDVLFSDVVMPGDMDGVALASEATRRWPKLRVLMTSGYVQEPGGVIGTPGAVLGKPYRRDDLAQAIQATRAPLSPG
jgi:CheY-like chemotaxis protein